VIFLLSTGKADARTTAYNEYINLKRWFIVDEFESYIDKLDAHRSQQGVKPLRDIMEEIYNERSPQTNWNALEGPEYPICMPELDKLVPKELQRPNGILPQPEAVRNVPIYREIITPPIVKSKRIKDSEQIELMLF
jgi:hypothetical protein